jgi:hypothetical protein
MYHLGNSDLKTGHVGRIFFAYDLLSQDSQREAAFLEFALEFRLPMAAFLARIIHGLF